MFLRIIRCALASAKFLAGMAAVFAALVCLGYFLLVVWDRTHQPSLPGISKGEPAAASLTTRTPRLETRP